jgi:6-phosphogluconolactonase
MVGPAIVLMRKYRFNVWSALSITWALLSVPLHAQFVYDGDNTDVVFGFTINPATGALTAIAGPPFAAGAGAGPVEVAVHPSGRFAYVASFTPSTITGYTINPATGALTAIEGSPFVAGSTPYSVAVDPSGKFANVANLGSNTVSGYNINPASGALTAIGGSPSLLE